MHIGLRILVNIFSLPSAFKWSLFEIEFNLLLISFWDIPKIDSHILIFYLWWKVKLTKTSKLEWNFIYGSPLCSDLQISNLRLNFTTRIFHSIFLHIKKTVKLKFCEFGQFRHTDVTYSRFWTTYSDGICNIISSKPQNFMICGNIYFLPSIKIDDRLRFSVLPIQVFLKVYFLSGARRHVWNENRQLSPSALAHSPRSASLRHWSGADAGGKKNTLESISVRVYFDHTTGGRRGRRTRGRYTRETEPVAQVQRATATAASDSYRSTSDAHLRPICARVMRSAAAARPFYLHCAHRDLFRECCTPTHVAGPPARRHNKTHSGERTDANESRRKSEPKDRFLNRFCIFLLGNNLSS
jgi:hypothetical protein